MTAILIRINSQVFAFFSDVLLFDMKYRDMCFASADNKGSEIYTLHAGQKLRVVSSWRLAVSIAAAFKPPTIWCQQK